MKKLLIVVVGLTGAGYLAWRYWQEVNAENAQAWAAGTDPVS